MNSLVINDDIKEKLLENMEIINREFLDEFLNTIAVKWYECVAKDDIPTMDHSIIYPEYVDYDFLEFMDDCMRYNMHKNHPDKFPPPGGWTEEHYEEAEEEFCSHARTHMSWVENDLRVAFNYLNFVYIEEHSTGIELKNPVIVEVW